MFKCGLVILALKTDVLTSVQSAKLSKTILSLVPIDTVGSGLGTMTLFWTFKKMQEENVN